MKVSTTAVLRSVPQPNDGAAFREDAAKRLPHALNQLLQLNLASPLLTGIYGHVTAERDHKWSESQVYIETMSRRIRDTIGLQVEDEVVNGITV